MIVGNTGIYIIESPSKNIYIGQSRNLKYRYWSYKAGKTKGQPALHKSIKKYGFEAHTFSVLQYLPDDISQQDLNNLEIFCIDQYRQAGRKMLNIRDGGSFGKHSKETLQKISVKVKKKMSQKGFKKRISKIRKGKTISVYQKKRLADGRAKRVYKPMSPEHKEAFQKGALKAITGRFVSEETKAKISAAQKGKPRKPMTKEQIEKIRLKSIGRKMPPHAKQRIREAREVPIIQFRLSGAKVRVWRSSKIACETIVGMKRHTLCRAIKLGKPYMGFLWKKTTKEVAKDWRSKRSYEILKQKLTA